MDQYASAYLNYAVSPALEPTPSKIEGFKIKALQAITHIDGLARLLQCIECSIECRPDLLGDRVDNLVKGVQVAGALIAIISDSAYTDVEELFDEATGVEKIDLQHRQQ